MRIRLTFEDPLPAYKCWYEVPASCSTIRDLQRAVRKGFNLDQHCKTTRLDLDGFFLLPASTIAGSLKDGDLLQVMIRRKGDSLPPRHLPVSGGKKRSSEDAGLSNSARRSSKKMKSTPHSKKPTVPLAKQDNAQKQQSGESQQRQQQQQQQPNGQKNNKKNKQNTKKAKKNNNSQTQQNSNNKSQQNNQQSTPKNPKGAVTAGTKGLKNNRTAAIDRKKSVNERREVLFAPESSSQRKKTTATESSSDDDSSDSSSSDSSDSSKDSSDSSNSDSDSSDDSDSDSSSSSSSSDSVSNKKNETKAVATRIVPGKGMGATKSRNARRRLLKMKLAEAREEADSQSDPSGTNPLKRRPIAVTRLADTTPATSATPPLQTSGKAAKAASQANGKDSAHDNKKTTSPQANGKSTAQTSAPPKVIMTSVDLKDSEFMTKTTPKRVTRSSQRSNGTAQEPPAAPQPEILVKQKDSGNNKIVTTEKDSDDTSGVDITPRDYNSLPKSEDNLAVGDLIAFKTLEMGPSYEPIISDFKEATVLSTSMTDMTAEVQLARQFRTPVQLDDDGNPILGKFDIYDEEEVERARRGIVFLDILGLADCRIISKK
ncbi:hypothetical protein BG015_006787 [Linnemannia schmuckeri]|uniref:Coilin n=1 Tax=Linnemannia schmuckeri TaxID=64567 RepID=A0A9P5S6J1_9FUNG|nr:hypothetical protein BG015_006787 [Linnemannia schmuckeri]